MQLQLLTHIPASPGAQTATVVPLDASLPYSTCGSVSNWSHTSSSCDPCTAPLPVRIFCLVYDRARRSSVLALLRHALHGLAGSCIEGTFQGGRGQLLTAGPPHLSLQAPFFFVDLAGVGLGGVGPGSKAPDAAADSGGGAPPQVDAAEGEVENRAAQGGGDEEDITKELLERLQSPFAVTCFSGARVLTSLSVSVLSFSDRWVDVAKVGHSY